MWRDKCFVGIKAFAKTGRTFSDSCFANTVSVDKCSNPDSYREAEASRGNVTSNVPRLETNNKFDRQKMDDTDIDLRQFKLIRKIQTDDFTKIIFSKINSNAPEKILVLKNVVVSIDKQLEIPLQKVRVLNPAGSHGLDMSLRLGRPEIEKFHEIFIFVAPLGKIEFHDYSFRALAKDVIWREYNIATDK